MRLDNHELQPTERANEVWAVIHEEDRGSSSSSVLGRYDTKHFAFVSCMRFPDVIFESAQTYIDQKDRVIWIAVNGDLLRVPDVEGETTQ